MAENLVVVSKIKKMVKDAELHADEDRKFNELITARNQADQLIYSSEKTVAELGDKITPDEKGKINSALERLKKAKEKEDVAEIKSAIEELTKSSHTMAQKMYEQANKQSGGQAGPGGAHDDPAAGGTDPQVLAGDLRVLDDELRAGGVAADEEARTDGEVAPLEGADGAGEPRRGGRRLVHLGPGDDRAAMHGRRGRRRRGSGGRHPGGAAGRGSGGRHAGRTERGAVSGGDAGRGPVGAHGRGSRRLLLAQDEDEHDDEGQGRGAADEAGRPLVGEPAAGAAVAAIGPAEGAAGSAGGGLGGSGGGVLSLPSAIFSAQSWTRRLASLCSGNSPITSLNVCLAMEKYSFQYSSRPCFHFSSTGPCLFSVPAWRTNSMAVLIGTMKLKPWTS